MKTILYNQKAESIGEIELNPKIFEVKPNEHLLAEAVRIQLSNARKGLANTKTRGEVRGGGKKPWKQKGTGRARAGSIRSPLWKGGGITFGPKSNRNWQLKMNKKAKTKALFMTLSDKASEKRFIVIDKIVLDKPKTKEFFSILEVLKDKVKNLGKKQMVLFSKKDDALIRASRNIPSVSPVLARNLNLIDVINADVVIALKDALPVIEKTYLKSSKQQVASSK